MKGFVSLAVLATVLIGCVSVGPTDSAAPSVAIPTLGITTPAAPTPTASAAASPSAVATPTAATSASPTATATATATASATPSVEPTVTDEPTTQPSLVPPEDFGANQLLFAETFDDPASGWGVGTNAGGTISYTDGTLQLATADEQNWIWSRRTATESWNVFHVEADLTPSGSGFAGLLCADSDDLLYGVLVSTEGVYAFFTVGAEGSEILSSGQDLAFGLTVGEPTRIGLDCAGTAIGSFRMQLSNVEAQIATTYEADVGVGDEQLDRAGVYAESGTHPWTLTVDDLIAYGGNGGAGNSPEAEALLLHVPADWRDSCFETSVNPFEEGQVAALSCSLDGDRSDVIDYVQFDTQANMDAAYDSRVETWVTVTGANCETSPGEGNYTVGGSAAGRLLCAPGIVGTRLDWTYDALTILSTLTDFEGSYADMWADWQIAGPE